MDITPECPIGFIEVKDFMDNMKVKLKYPKEGLNSIQEP